MSEESLDTLCLQGYGAVVSWRSDGVDPFKSLTGLSGTSSSACREPLRVRQSSPDAGKEPARAGDVRVVRRTVSSAEVRFLDKHHLRDDADGEGSAPARGEARRNHQERPGGVGRHAPVKMGLRTRVNGPAVTSSVSSVGSTPIRHESCIARCAARVSANPATMTRTPVTSSTFHAVRLAATVPATRRATPDASAQPAAFAVTPRSRWATNPVEPVRRRCWTDCQPNATTAKRTWNVSAVSAGSMRGSLDRVVSLRPRVLSSADADDNGRV